MSPQTYARTGGILYLYIIVAALFAELYVRGSLIVDGDAVATARNILGSEALFRVGLAGEMLTCACDVTLAMILYTLLEPVSRPLALLGAFFRITFVAVYAGTKLFEIAALVLLHRTDLDRREALAYASLRVHSLGYGASLLFFGFCCAVFGYLIRRSRYLPRTIGVLLIVAGAAYVVFSIAQIVAPEFAGKVLFPWLLLPAFPAELGLSLWLIVKGVDLAKWNDAAQV